MAVARVARITVSGCLAALAVLAETPAPEDIEFFESKIRPVLATNCYTCHSAEAKVRMGGLSLDTRDGIREGGQRGHAVMPGDVEGSLILSALRYDGALKMPPGGRLSEDVVANFEEWIRMGAPDPREVEVQVTEDTIDLDKGREFWAFQVPRRPGPPSTTDLAWPFGRIDQLVLAGMEEHGLRPASDARKEDLLRRATLDLTGLPPTPEELENFLNDDGDRAYNRVIDRLLESDRFGERWGRHWLDVVRYADTVGRTRNLPFPVAWRYRDYVIRSFNDDKPFELFTAIGKAGGSEPAHLEGLSRMVSLCLRSGIAPNVIIEQLSGITSEPVWDNGVLIRSAEDGVAHVLRRHLNGRNKPGLASMNSESVAQLGLFATPKYAESSADYVPDVPLGGCPKCNGRVVHQEGCIRCLECGYTKCE